MIIGISKRALSIKNWTRGSSWRFAFDPVRPGSTSLKSYPIRRGSRRWLFLHSLVKGSSTIIRSFGFLMSLYFRWSLFALKVLTYWNFSQLAMLLWLVSVKIVTIRISKFVAFQKQISFTSICSTWTIFWGF